MSSPKILKLKTLLNSITPVPESEWPHLEKSCSVVTYKKGECFLRAGDFDTHMALIISGLVKRSYISDQGKEYVQYFGQVGQFSGAYTSILLKTESKVNLTAIEDTEVVKFDFRKYQELYDRHICWERIVRISIEEQFIEREKREYQLLMCNAKERYEEFLNEFSDCHQRLSNKDIASYLRIAPETFSRLKSNMLSGSRSSARP